MMSEKIGTGITSKFSGAVIKPKKTVNPDDLKDTTNSKKLAIAAKHKKEVTLNGLINENQMIFKNWMIEGMRLKFPNSPSMWHVEKMIKLKNGKRLLIDEPVRDWELKESQAKASPLKELGFLFVIIKPHATLAEALVDAGIGSLD